MKTTKAVLALAALLAGVFATESAFAWHRARVGVGFYFGVPIGGFPTIRPTLLRTTHRRTTRRRSRSPMSSRARRKPPRRPLPRRATGITARIPARTTLT